MAAIKDWSLQLNVAGLALFEPGLSLDRIPGGVYPALITATERDSSKSGGADNIVFAFEVTEGAAKGKKAKIWMSIDPNLGEGLMGRKWKNLLACVAKDPSVLEKGSINLKPSTFEKKVMFIHVQEVPGKDEKGRDNLPNISPITKEQYEKFKAEGYGAPASGATATGAQGSMEVKGGAATNGASAPHAAAEVTLD